MTMQSKNDQRLQRARKTRAKAKISGRPRLLVYKSLTAIYAQVIDDEKHAILCGTSNLKGKAGMIGAEAVGTEIAKLAKEKKVSEVAFDRNGFAYTGQIKVLADAARKGGLKF